MLLDGVVINKVGSYTSHFSHHHKEIIVEFLGYNTLIILKQKDQIHIIHITKAHLFVCYFLNC